MATRARAAVLGVLTVSALTAASRGPVDDGVDAALFAFAAEPHGNPGAVPDGPCDLALDLARAPDSDATALPVPAHLTPLRLTGDLAMYDRLVFTDGTDEAEAVMLGLSVEPPADNLLVATFLRNRHMTIRIGSGSFADLAPGYKDVATAKALAAYWPNSGEGIVIPHRFGPYPSAADIEERAFWLRHEVGHVISDALFTNTVDRYRHIDAIDTPTIIAAAIEVGGDRWDQYSADEKPGEFFANADAVWVGVRNLPAAERAAALSDFLLGQNNRSYAQTLGAGLDALASQRFACTLPLTAAFTPATASPSDTEPPTRPNRFGGPTSGPASPPAGRHTTHSQRRLAHP